VQFTASLTCREEEGKSKSLFHGEKERREGKRECSKTTTGEPRGDETRFTQPLNPSRGGPHPKQQPDRDLNRQEERGELRKKKQEGDPTDLGNGGENRTKTKKSRITVERSPISRKGKGC